MKKNIRLSLAAASCALLGSHGAMAEDKHDVGDWDISAALLFYSEPDRVTATEPVISAKKQIDTDETLTLKLTLDTLTGASANGAVPTNRPQSFTSPSGGTSAYTAAGETPLDESFKDTRVAVNAAWEKPIAKDLTMVLGTNFSTEYDYTSFAVSSTFAKDINNSNTTLMAGLSLGMDMIEPVNGKPVAFGTLQTQGDDDDEDDDGNKVKNGSDDTKSLVDIVVGVTQVIDQNSLFQLSYSLSSSSGYLTDPYKFISVVDPTTGIPLFENNAQPDLPTVVYENRPDSRLKHSVFGQYKRYIGGDVLDTSYRFMVDDWGITSNTIDVKYRWKFADTQYLQPHVRVYQQSAADFYTPFFIDGQQPTVGDTNSEASADYRLGEFMAYTVGLEYGQDNPSNSWSVALEYYLQTGDEPSQAFGELKNQELYPDVDALMLRVVYDF
ncbi:DUF3570 domain-containing protein [Zhongshania sp. BJYM1]|uniref:DUF3570 domain-containing protein n=1 Tax=Zhongshania aquatica TaxID=2965069 RepID=UPI0022B48B2B|nr:DUF3570 domain-containing protein [Marortus sp. BJYM1]